MLELCLPLLLINMDGSDAIVDLMLDSITGNGANLHCSLVDVKIHNGHIQMEDVGDVAAVLEKKISEASIARAKAHYAKKAATTRCREIRGKSICKEDIQAQQQARQNSTIRKYFLSSRNSQNTQPLFLVCDSMLVPLDPKSTSEDSKDGTKYVFVDTSVVDEKLGSANSVLQKVSSSQQRNLGLPSTTLEADQVKEALRVDMVHISNENEEVETDDDFQEIAPPIKKLRPNYDRAHLYQEEWFAKLVWAEPIRSADGQVHLVKCTMCSTFEKKPKILRPK